MQIQSRLLNFKTKSIVGVQQSVTLNCRAEGNPPPIYAWTPCNDPDKFVTRIFFIFHKSLMMTAIPAEWPMYMEMIQKLPLFVSHMYIVVMLLTAVSSYMYQHDVLMLLNKGLAYQVIKAHIVPLLCPDG